MDIYRQGSLTVFFNGQFWIAIVVSKNNQMISVGEYIFGPEPTNAQLDDWTNKGCPGLRMIEISNEFELEKIFKIKKRVISNNGLKYEKFAHSQMKASLDLVKEKRKKIKKEKR